MLRLLGLFLKISLDYGSERYLSDITVIVSIWYRPVRAFGLLAKETLLRCAGIYYFLKIVGACCGFRPTIVSLEYHIICAEDQGKQ